MAYEGLVFAAVLGMGLALVVGMFLTSTQLEPPQTYGEETRRRRRDNYEGTRRRRGGYNNRREGGNYEQVTCPICHERLQFRQMQLGELKCGHIYHNNCIQRWFAEQSKKGGCMWCPVCREPCRNVVTGSYSRYT